MERPCSHRAGRHGGPASPLGRAHMRPSAQTHCSNLEVSDQAKAEKSYHLASTHLHPLFLLRALLFLICKSYCGLWILCLLENFRCFLFSNFYYVFWSAEVFNFHEIGLSAVSFMASGCWIFLPWEGIPHLKVVKIIDFIL